MPRNAAFQRGKPTRPVGRKLIIAVEGKKTEYGYFEAIRQELSLSRDRIRVVQSDPQPLKVVEKAINELEASRAYRATLKEDSAWAVFDGDEHIKDDLAGWHQALALARKHKINIAVSNPSFEIWYLLHFQDQTRHLTSQVAFHALKSHVRNYDKALVLYPDPLKEATNNAIARAKILEERGEEISVSPHRNPCTGVWKLVNALLALETSGGR